MNTLNFSNYPEFNLFLSSLSHEETKFLDTCRRKKWITIKIGRGE